MTLLTCMLQENRCYTTAQPVKVVGAMLHSTGADNPNLKRYVQPSGSDPDYDLLMAKLGVNRNGNDWNCPRPGGASVCVHGFIGKLADGSVVAVQTLPWDIVGWHSGYANKYSQTNANKLGYIGVEICEDDLDDPDYFAQVYREAVELFAMLALQFGFDPLGTNEYDLPCVLCHREGYDLGIASAHADVLHWFPKYGKTMDDFRRDVAEEMEDIQMVRYKYLKDIPADWDQRNIVELLMDAGILKGDGSDPTGNGDVIDLSKDMVRMLIFNYRGGCYDNAIRAAGLNPNKYR